MVMPMKTSLATTISIAGVVAAGAFTVAVNSSMLNSVSTSTDIAAVEAPVLMSGSSIVTDLSIPLAIDVPGQGVGSQSAIEDRSATTSSPLQVNAPTTTVQVGQAIVSSYSIEGAASLKLVQSANHLSVGGVKPVDGYVFSSDNVSPTRVIVTLTNSSHRLKFNAEIIGGRVVTSLISSDVVAPVVTAAPAVAASPSSTTPRRSRDSRRENQNRQKDEDEDEDDNRSNRDRRGDNDDD
jgi:hypothetical protein